MKLKVSTLVVFCGLPIGCGGIVDDEVVETEVTEDEKADSAKTISIASGYATRFKFKAPGTPITVTVACPISNNPDDVGATFIVSAPSLVGASTPATEPRAGYWSWSGTASKAQHTITLSGRASNASCKATVKKQRAAATCTTRTIHHSQNTNHTHLRVGSDASSDWETFPASGNHWGAWPAWNKVYARPVKRGFLLHGLEHGGLVLSYKCASSTESAACRDAEAALTSLAETFGKRRLIVTPDPTQPTQFAIRAWRWAYLADCVDTPAATAFMNAYHRNGREDVDADPPVPYDPTTTNVPCEDLMAAPDSCP